MVADAMVTARMSQEKKQEAGKVLEGLGMSASQVINQLYDYLVQNKSLPFGEKKRLRNGDEISPEEWRAAREWVDSFPYVSLEGEFADMAIKEARSPRPRAEGEFDGLGECHEAAS